MDRVAALGSSPSDTSAVNREIRAHFEYLAKMKRNMAKRDRESRKPKRPLSAYNLFFKSERRKLVKEKRRVGFSDMAKEIAAKWKVLDIEGRKQLDEEVVHEKRRYEVTLTQWKAQAKLDQKKLTTHQQQHIIARGDHVPTPPSVVARNKPDPNLLSPSVQQGVVEKQQARQAQLENDSLSAGACRMFIPLFTSPEVEGLALESFKSLPTSHFEGNTGHHFSRAKMTPNHEDMSFLYVLPLSSFDAGSSDPDVFFEPLAFGDSGDDGACMDPEIANAIMTIPFSDVHPCADESGECFESMASGMLDNAMPFSFVDLSEGESHLTYGSMISCMVEPSPMMPSLTIDTQRFGFVRRFTRPIGRVAEMKELREIIQLLDRAVATEASSIIHGDAELT